MRFRKKTYLGGEYRFKRIFLFFPTKVCEDETRWLEYVILVESYNSIMLTSGQHKYWKKEYYLNDFVTDKYDIEGLSEMLIANDVETRMLAKKIIEDNLIQ